MPYGEKFCTVSRYCFTQARAGACRLRVACEVRYPRGAPWAMTTAMIERAAYASLAEYFTALAAALRTHVLAHPVVAAAVVTAATAAASSSSSLPGLAEQPTRAETLAEAVEAEAAVVVAAARAELRGPTWVTLLAVALLCFMAGWLAAAARLSPAVALNAAALTDWFVLGVSV